MARTWNSNAITSDRTPHSARLIPGSLEYWEVSYLPGIPLEYADARMAMTIAEDPCLGDENLPLSKWDPQDLGTWVRQGLWADILGLDIDAVRESASRPPAWTAGGEGYCKQEHGHFLEQRRQPQREAAESAAERDDPEAGS